MFVVVGGGGSEFAGLSEWVCLDVSCREFNPKFPICEKQKNRENTRQRKIITCTRQYLCGSAICLRPRSYKNFTIIKEKEIQGAATVFLLTLKTRPHQKP